MKRNTIHLVLLIALLASLLMIRNTAVAQSGTPEEPRYFSETGYSIKGVFRRYWESQGGLTVFGYPISGQAKAVNPADGKLYETQWFERHRMEYHPELANDPNYYILLGLLGQELAKTSISASVTPSNLLQGNCRSVEGVQVCGRFRTYWDAFGLNFGPNETYRNSLALHGKPVSPVVTTQIEGKSYQVQWFERARFEWHGPGSVDTKPVGAVPGSFDVLFGLLGNAMRPKNFTAETSLPYAEQLTMQRASNNRGSLNYNAAAPVQLQASAGTDMMLVPPLTPPSISPEELIANPSRLSGVVIGGLRVVSALPDIPVGIYVVTLRDDGNALHLEGESGHVVELPAVIRKLALGYLVPTSTVAALPADAARKLGFNRQICYGWEQTQICGLFNADQVTQTGFSALAGRQVDASQTLPLVAGAAPLDQCVRG
ncbi:MAG: hypothetical protein HGA19_15725, partial [Oscillochloris sp.]|nr:hypothetical protein [Oscillochloris sp.]